MAASVKYSPSGMAYTITNLWDEIAFQLICAKEAVFGGVKKTIADAVDMVISPASDAIKKIGKGLTSWIPILLVGLLVVGAVYFIFLRGKAKVGV